MKLNEAIETLDAVIPPPNHSTVDLAHLQIAQAWQTVKETIHLQQKETDGRLTARNELGFPYFPECFKKPCEGAGCKKKDCQFITEVCKALALFEDEQQTKDKGCHWCKMQTDEFGDQHMTASEIKVISQDRFGKRELPRKFCSVCGRNLEGDT